jgi:thiosulfate sulfurtransferase
MLIKSLKYLITAVILNYSGCLKNPAEPPVSFQMNNSAELLTYLEEEGDYINSGSAPSLIEAQEVFANLNNYLIIDVRPADQFISGHIEGAVNVQNNNLLNFLSDNGNVSYPKIVIVSQTGQAASYYACLLILLGHNNVYAMNFGMAAWNEDFSRLWLQHTKNFSYLNTFNNGTPLYNDLSGLPDLAFSASSKTLQDKLKERIELLLNEGFRDNPEDA